MIATMNQCSWIGIILGAVLFAVGLRVFDAYGWPQNTMFAVTAALMLPVAIFYRPRTSNCLTTKPKQCFIEPLPFQQRAA